MREIHAVVLAAGKGTRMKSETPKVLTKLLGTPIIDYILSTIQEISPNSITVITKHQADEVEKHISSKFENINFVRQVEMDGTGAAVYSFIEQFKNKLPKESVLLVLGGDAPLITPSILVNLVGTHKQNESKVSLATTKLNDPYGYGRIVRDNSGIIQGIVEETNASPQIQNIQEVNTSVYAFNSSFLIEEINNLESNNSKGELFLTDLVEKASPNVSSYIEPFSMFLKSFNDRYELSQIEQFLIQGAVTSLQKRGVTIANPYNIYIEPSVIVEEDVTLLEGTRLQGDTVIKKGAIIGPNTYIIDSVVGEKSIVESSKVIGSKIGNEANVGPFTYLRPGTELEDNTKVGSYTEVKNSKIGKGSKVPHLSYVGDTTIGENSNLGAGTITANYDGKNKHKTKIGSDVRIGSDTVLVAPVEVGDRVYSGAGSVIRHDVPSDSLVYSENSETIKEYKGKNKE